VGRIVQALSHNLDARTKSVDAVCQAVLRTGRWLARTHPQVHSPDDWTRDLALEYVVSLNHPEVGDFVAAAPIGKRLGVPLLPRSNDRSLACLRIFFRDCQGWGWCACRFDPGVCLRLPNPQEL
jgi:hypothetical protein